MEREHFLQDYSNYKVSTLEGRYFPYQELKKKIEAYQTTFNLQEIGESVLKQPIFKLQIGHGAKKVLLWSQMHGNETTITKALLDVINYFNFRKAQLKEFLETISLHIIPVLNPDGCNAYTRVNANKIDLNRDAQNLSQPESKLLRKEFDKIKPDYCFNLHDQRSIFSAGWSPNTAALSFLAPAADAEKTIIPNRLQAMQLISGINDVLQKYIPNKIGRYDDTFNENCVGDTFQAKDATTILFEAGHLETDYKRELTRKYGCFAILEALNLIYQNSYKTYKVENYEAIPKNQKLFLDVIIRNVRFQDKITDVGIQYKEHLAGNKLLFLPFIRYINNLESFYGHREIDANRTKIVVNNTDCFYLGTEIQNLAIKNGYLPINLTIT